MSHSETAQRGPRAGLAPVRSARTPADEGRAFAYAIGGVLVAIAIFISLRGRTSGAAWVAIAGALLLLAGMFLPARLVLLARAWASFGLLLSRVTTPLVLGVIYFLVITPVGLFRRAAGRNALKRSRSAESFWVPARQRADPRRALERQF